MKACFFKIIVACITVTTMGIMVAADIMTGSFYGRRPAPQEAVPEGLEPATTPRSGGLKSPAALYSDEDIGFIDESAPLTTVTEQAFAPTVYNISEEVVVLDKATKSLLVGKIETIKQLPATGFIEYGINVNASNLRIANSDNTGNWIIERSLLGAEFPLTSALSCGTGPRTEFVIIKDHTTGSGIAAKIIDAALVGRGKGSQEMYLYTLDLGSDKGRVTTSTEIENDPARKIIICDLTLGDILPGLLRHKSMAERRHRVQFREPEVREIGMITKSQIESRVGTVRTAYRPTLEEQEYIMALGETPETQANRILSEQGRFAAPASRRRDAEPKEPVSSDLSKAFKERKALGARTAREAAVKARAKLQAAGFVE